MEKETTYTLYGREVELATPVTWMTPRSEKMRLVYQGTMKPVRFGDIVKFKAYPRCAKHGYVEGQGEVKSFSYGTVRIVTETGFVSIGTDSVQGVEFTSSIGGSHNDFYYDYQETCELVTSAIDRWVERIGTLGAMKLHPNEFTADEIIAEFNADNLNEMTEGMALVIESEYGEKYDRDELSDPAEFFPVQHAIELLN